MSEHFTQDDCDPEWDEGLPIDECTKQQLTKSAAIRMKDRLQSKSEYEFAYYVCPECDAHHVEQTNVFKQIKKRHHT